MGGVLDEVLVEYRMLGGGKLQAPIIFVLAGPRSGSSLLQMMLNHHPGLFAPQVLYFQMPTTVP
jgi:hypothetical protein